MFGLSILRAEGRQTDVVYKAWVSLDCHYQLDLRSYESDMCLCGRVA